MNEEVLQAAAQTFCLVPEVYAQAFKQAGADFPDELVAQIKKQPEQAMQMLKEDQELFKGVVTIYSKYKDQIDQAAAQAAQQTGLFKKGGKLDYLITRFKKGGKTDGDDKEKSKVRQRGEARAYSNGFMGSGGNYAYTPEDGTWTKVDNNHEVKNVFSGDDLYQYIVSQSDYDPVPRRSTRIIYNYASPTKADTVYVDAKGIKSHRNPSWLRRLFEYNSPRFIQRVDDILKPFDPYAFNEEEVKALEKEIINKKK